MKSRATLARFGPMRGGVRVLEDGLYVRVQWYRAGQRRVKSWPRTQAADAIEWGRQLSEMTRTPRDLPEWSGRVRGRGVYVVEAPGTGDIKIGIARDVGQRIAELQRHYSRPLRLLLVLQGGVTLERSLLARFSDCRLKGEWFRADPELGLWIERTGNELRTPETVIKASSEATPEAGLEPATRCLSVDTVSSTTTAKTAKDAEHKPPQKRGKKSPTRPETVTKPSSPDVKR